MWRGKRPEIVNIVSKKNEMRGLQKEGLVCKIRDVVFYIFAKIHRVYSFR